MALSIISITPDNGLTSGWDRVIIQGTDFDIHPYPPAQSGYIGDQGPSLKVFFGDMEADPRLIEVFEKPGGAAGETTIECTIPRYLGDPELLPVTIDVTVENLLNPDSVTEADFFTFKRPSAVTNSVLNLVIKALILQFRRQLPVEQVVLRTHSNYDDDVSGGLNIVQISKTPAIMIQNISPRRSIGVYRRQHQILEDEGSSWGRYRQPTCLDLSFIIRLVDKHSGRLLNLVDMFSRFADENGYLVVEQVPNDPSQGTVKFDIEYDKLPEVDTPGDLNNLVSATGGFTIFGVPSDRVDGIRLGTAEEVDEISLDMRYIDLF